MKELEYKICDPIGMHARPAAKLVQELTRFKSKVTLRLGTKEANAKSIINLMALGIKSNSSVTFLITGDDEADLLAALPEILKKHNI